MVNILAKLSISLKNYVPTNEGFIIHGVGVAVQSKNNWKLLPWRHHVLQNLGRNANNISLIYLTERHTVGSFQVSPEENKIMFSGALFQPNSIELFYLITSQSTFDVKQRFYVQVQGRRQRGGRGCGRRPNNFEKTSET